MWPERLLRVAHIVRELMSGPRIADFFQLIQLSEPRSLGEVEAYNAQCRHVLGALIEVSLRLLEVADKLSIPMGSRLRSEVEAARQNVQEAAYQIEATRPLHLQLRPLSSEDASLVVSNLPAYDFVPIARAAALGAAVSKLCIVLEEERARCSEQLERVNSLASEFLRVWEWRSPENLCVSGPEMTEAFHRAFGSSADLDVGLKLSSLRRWRRSDRQRFHEEAVKIVHATVEEVRGHDALVALPVFHAQLSAVTFFLDVGMNDVMVCLADLKNRGWVEGMEEKRGREVLVLRQPDIENLVSDLKKRLGEEEVTTRRAVEAMGWDYFTSLHLVKQLELRGELEPDEDTFGERIWRWRDDAMMQS